MFHVFIVMFETCITSWVVVAQLTPELGRWSTQCPEDFRLCYCIHTNANMKTWINVYMSVCILAQSTIKVRQLVTNLQQKGHGQAAGLTLQAGQWGQAPQAQPSRLPPDFAGKLRRPKPPRLHFLQETKNHLRRGHLRIAGHIMAEIICLCGEQAVLTFYDWLIETKILFTP